ncbi:MAG: 1-deoxy-D-xylulose-5-phosphate reductoisomerase [Alphaproteobacteria bacterium]
MVSELKPRTVSILGATGSVGRSTMEVVGEQGEAFAVEAVTAHTDVAALAKIARSGRARVAVMADPQAYGDLKDALAGSDVTAAAGPQALVEAAERPVDITVAAIVGAAGLAPTYAATRAGNTVALANKECLVSAGQVFLDALGRFGGELLPLDSEHNAIFQILHGRATQGVERIILTASGGPFRQASPEAIAAAQPIDALNHPNWSMGAKISIDSATMMNKGLEVIEARHLFGLERTRIDVLIHPESVVHGLVEFTDGSQIAALGVPDMRAPIAHCLAWPQRSASTHTQRLDLTKDGPLTFEPMDRVRFPVFQIAMEALDAGGWATNILSAANEVAVAAFLAERIGFTEIAEVVAETLEYAANAGYGTPTSIEEAIAVDGAGRRLATECLVRRSDS